MSLVLIPPQWGCDLVATRPEQGYGFFHLSSICLLFRKHKVDPANGLCLWIREIRVIRVCDRIELQCAATADVSPCFGSVGIQSQPLLKCYLLLLNGRRCSE